MTVPEKGTELLHIILFVSYISKKQKQSIVICCCFI